MNFFRSLYFEELSILQINSQKHHSTFKTYHIVERRWSAKISFIVNLVGEIETKRFNSSYPEFFNSGTFECYGVMCCNYIIKMMFEHAEDLNYNKHQLFQQFFRVSNPLILSAIKTVQIYLPIMWIIINSGGEFLSNKTYKNINMPRS